MSRTKHARPPRTERLVNQRAVLAQAWIDVLDAALLYGTNGDETLEEDSERLLKRIRAWVRAGGK